MTKRVTRLGPYKQRAFIDADSNHGRGKNDMESTRGCRGQLFDLKMSGIPMMVVDVSCRWLSIPVGEPVIL